MDGQLKWWHVILLVLVVIFGIRLVQFLAQLWLEPGEYDRFLARLKEAWEKRK